MSTQVGAIHYALSLDTSRFDRQTSDIDQRLNGLSNNFRNIGKKMTAFVTLPVLAAGAGAVKAAADYEQLQVAMTTMLGSAERATSLLRELDDLAVKTPFQITEVQNAARQMLAYGIEAEKVVDTTRMLGDVSAGLGTETFPQLTLAYGQIRAKGKLMGQELLQLTNAGFNLAEAMGVSRGELMEMMETGDGVTFDDVEKAFKRATSEGGRFFNLMENQSKTTAGQFSNLKDELIRFARDIGTLMLPTINSLLSTLRNLGARFEQLTPFQQKMILMLALIAAAIGPVLIGLSFLITSIRNIATAVSFVAAHPAILAWTAAILAVAAIAFLIIKNWDTVKSWFVNFAKFVTGVFKSVKDAIISDFNRTRNAISSAMSFVSNVVSRTASGLASIFRTVINWFTSLPGRIRSAVSGISGIIFSPFRTAFNQIARMWNRTVGSIGFTTPDWVPGLGGRGWSIPDIPTLAQGGIVTKPTLAMIGEGGESEAVIPLSKLGQMANTTNFYAPVNIDKEADAQQILRTITRNQMLEVQGVAT